MKKVKPKIKFKYKFFLYGFLLFAYIVVAFTFVNSKAHEKRCLGVNIEIADSSAQMFITPKDINKLLKENGFEISGYPIGEINDLEVEDSILGHPSIKDADVYKSKKGYLNIRITQRKPIVRVLDATGDSYYIDERGKLMPLSLNYTARVPVITGQFSRSYEDYRNVNLSKDRSDTLLYDLFSLAKEIKNNRYWSAQCEQISVNEKKDIILIPKMGADEIILGQNRNFVKDLDILTAFYQQALPYVGWDKYKTLNLKYNQQIVCVK